MVIQFSFKRILKKGLIGLVAAEVAYVIAAYIFLNNGTLQKLVNVKPEKIQMSYDSAYSIIPGRVHVKNGALRVSDEAMQLYFVLDHATIGVDLFRLNYRIFHARYVHADNLKFYIRFKRYPAILAKTKLSALAPIPGFAVPLRTPPEPIRPTNPWKIWIQGIDIASLSEFWFEEFRFRGKIGVAGGFYLHPKRDLEIEPSTLTVHDGMLEVGDKLTLLHTKGKIEADIKKFDANHVPEFEVLKYMSTTTTLTSQVENLEFINYYLREVSWMRLGKGRGSMELALKAKDGEVKDGSFFKSETAELTAKLGRQNIKGAGRVDWTMSEAKKENRLQLTLGDYRITHEKATDHAISGKKVAITAFAQNLDLSRPFEKVGLKVELPLAQIEDLRYFNVYFPKEGNLAFTSGKGQVNAAFESFPDGQRDTGKISLNTTQSQMKYRDRKFSGDLNVVADFAKSHFAKGQIKIGLARINIANAFAQRADKEKDKLPWAAEVDVQDSELNIESSPHGDFTVTVNGDNARPIYAFLDVETQGAIPGWLPSVVPFNKLAFQSHIQISDKELRADKVLLTGDNSTLSGWFRRTKAQGNSGRFLFEANPIAAAMEFNGKETRLRLQNAVAWFKEREREFPAPHDSKMALTTPAPSALRRTPSSQ